ncbi:MAG: hypothetical protein IKO00_07535, partial [Oscillospiraceae bacterium]|nr:hypothetical protein [Oscillospiraceae bacterium]
MEKCNGCLCMAVEDWPRGVKACRCMNPAEPTGSIRHFGRVLELFSLGKVGAVMRPKWCPASDGEQISPLAALGRN